MGLTPNLGQGSTAIPPTGVPNADLADMAQSTIKGRAAGAGTGKPQDLSVAQVLSIIQSTIALAASQIVSGLLALARGGTGADLSATGGATHFLRQASAGAAVTVGAIAASDLPTGIDAAKIGDGSVSTTKFQYLNTVTSNVQTQLSGRVALPNYYGKLYAAYGDCDPTRAMENFYFDGVVAMTPTNLTTSIARIAYFTPPADIVVNKIRYCGAGNTTDLLQVAIYNGTTLARLTSQLSISTTGNAWGSVGSALNLTLTKGTLYFIAVSTVNTGTTAAIMPMGANPSSNSGAIQTNVATGWPGNLGTAAQCILGQIAQFAVTTGALPDPAATIVAQTASTGGFPMFFLDNDNG